MCAPAAQRASSKPRSKLPTRPTGAGIALRIPAVDLWTTRQSMQPSAKKCYPCCRIKVLRMLPVAQNEASFSRRVLRGEAKPSRFLNVNTLLVAKERTEEVADRAEHTVGGRSGRDGGTRCARDAG